jgi:predicted RNA-binding protein YlxR (DUF448 family)
MCVVCGEKRPKRELIRIVHAPDGSLVVDPKGKQPGRGAYICRQEACWRVGLSPRVLARAFKARVGSEEVMALQDAIAERLAEDGISSGDAGVAVPSAGGQKGP